MAIQSRWATYENVNPPQIESNFFNTSTQTDSFYENPIVQFLYNQPTRYTEETRATQGQTVKQSEPEVQKKISEKKEKATQIVQSKEQPVNIPAKFTSNKQFVQVMISLYRRELSKAGLNPDLAVMLVSQDAGECGYGKDVKGDFNLGNITTTGNDWHVQSKRGHHWKDFKSYEDYVQYKIKFLSGKRYQFFTYADTNNISASMQKLANQGYDPGNNLYGQKVAQIAKSVKKYINNG